MNEYSNKGKKKLGRKKLEIEEEVWMNEWMNRDVNKEWRRKKLEIEEEEEEWLNEWMKQRW